MCSFTRVITGSVFPTLNRNLHAKFANLAKNRKFYNERDVSCAWEKSQIFLLRANLQPKFYWPFCAWA